MNITNLELYAFQFFISVVVISYSWTPIAFFSIPIFIIVSFAAVRVRLVNHVFFLYSIIIILIVYTLPHQILYVEWARNVLFIPLIMVSYILGDWLVRNQDKLRSVAICFFISALVVIIYTFLIAVPSDIALFIGDRRGYMAREYLFFGRFFEFSLGVTHLNLYINFCVVIIFATIINYGLKKKYIFGLLLLIMLGFLTQSRSPSLFAFIILCLYLIFQYKISKKKTSYLIVFSFSLLSLILVTSPIFIFSDILSLSSRLSSGGMTDVSRLLFFAKGWEHMTLEPLGNSLLYTDPKMPLLNYHNTFLSIGNRIAYFAFYIFIFLFFSCFIHINKINDIKLRFTLFLFLYFCLHNFMVEDVIKFDAFVLFVFLVLVTYVRRVAYIEKRCEDAIN